MVISGGVSLVERRVLALIAVTNLDVVFCNWIVQLGVVFLSIIGCLDGGLAVYWI